MFWLYITDSINADRVKEMVKCLSNQEDGEDDLPVKVPQTFEERKQLGKNHLL